MTGTRIVIVTALAVGDRFRDRYDYNRAGDRDAWGTDVWVVVAPLTVHVDDPGTVKNPLIAHPETRTDHHVDMAYDPWHDVELLGRGDGR
ncbi:hypothetical protein [Frankia sp. Cj3]|uniref:hypothetical protein n=1 Tax=Frankia sp. Cj3 TaxID=2880976 RepID=UPI001EF58208|nr:hypothetical protein [Frankia sp. Cj3]